MSKSKGRMLARTGWQGWDCKCCGPEPTKGQKRARDERGWRRAVDREHLDAMWGAYYEDTRRLADDFGFPAEQAHRESAEFATEMLATPQRRLSEAWL